MAMAGQGFCGKKFLHRLFLDYAGTWYMVCRANLISNLRLILVNLMLRLYRCRLAGVCASMKTQGRTFTRTRAGLSKAGSTRSWPRLEALQGCSSYQKAGRCSRVHKDLFSYVLP
jgi:hypothetical protein